MTQKIGRILEEFHYVCQQNACRCYWISDDAVWVTGPFPAGTFTAGPFPQDLSPPGLFPAGRFPTGRFPAGRFPARFIPRRPFPRQVFSPLGPFPYGFFPAGMFPSIFHLEIFSIFFFSKKKIAAKFLLISAKFILISTKLVDKTAGRACPPQSLIYANLTYLLPLSMHFSTMIHRRNSFFRVSMILS